MCTEGPGSHENAHKGLWFAQKDTWVALKGTERKMERSKVKWRALGHRERHMEDTEVHWKLYRGLWGCSGTTASPMSSVPAGSASQAGPEKFLAWAVALERRLFFPFSYGIRSPRKRWYEVHVQPMMLTLCTFQDGKLTISMGYLKRRRRTSTEKSNPATNPSEISQCWLQNQNY